MSTAQDDDTATAQPAGVPTFELRHRMALALETADLSISGMANHLEVSRNTVGNYIAGRTNPTVATLRVWALRCGVPFAWLRDGTVTPEGGGPNGTRDSEDRPSSRTW